MPDTQAIVRLLEQVRRRRWHNHLAQCAVGWATHALALLAAVTLWNLVMPESWAVPRMLTLAALVLLTAWHGRQAWRRDELWEAAVRADSAADLHDELTSAYWFSRNPEDDEGWIGLHVGHAAERARQLDPARLVPSQPPRGTAVPATLVTVLFLLWLVPVPRVFEGLDRRLAEIDLAELLQPSPTDEVGELEETGAREPEPELLSESALTEEEEALASQLEEQQQEGQDQLAEEEGQEQGDDSQSEESTEGDQQGEQAEGEQGEGQQMEAQDPEDMPADAEREASPDPSASQQDGQGDSTEESGAMLPGGEEVFLQEGGEDLEQNEMAEEELGHATREGGGEEELGEGMPPETLEVQLQREILAVPEEQPEPEPEAEKEELVTRAESSLLEFQDVTPEEFAVQELLQREVIPWRYRQLVLEYFKTLRARDNRPKEQEPR